MLVPVVLVGVWAFIDAGGKVVEHGTPEDLKTSSSEWVQQFLKALPDGPVPFHYPAEDYAESLLGRVNA